MHIGNDPAWHVSGIRHAGAAATLGFHAVHSGEHEPSEAGDGECLLPEGADLGSLELIEEPALRRRVVGARPAPGGWRVARR